MSREKLTATISMLKLGVNIDHIASLRELRHGIQPQPVIAGLLAEASGADSIVVHLREDRRHIKEEDLFLLKRSLKGRLNLEMSIAGAIVEIACRAKPDQATLVPEKRQELTTEGGLDVAGYLPKVKQAVEELQRSQIEVSLFIDPEIKQINASLKSGAKMIELHTGRYADAKKSADQDKYFRQIKSAVSFARAKGLQVNAGHGLDYQNVTRIAKIKGIEELNIGYAIICRAVIVGLGQAIREMKALMR